jgi:hypothetical protein
MPGFLFAERWSDKMLLTTIWLDVITGTEVFSALFFSSLLIFIIGMVSWKGDDNYCYG